MAALTVVVVSADREVWNGEATRVVARTTEGEIGVLAGHEPLMGL
ncbi:MAG TPA: F0F1 ATP synthase subunit epsilon, partial [Brevibacterium sp.]|nr:F0F1 ATP synthase subunit epsilon [Brevibacterium sp.]